MAYKTDGGERYPPEAYLYVPDPNKPSTWKIRIWESPDRKITRAQLGRAAAALVEGFRGQVVDLPLPERKRLARKLVSLYREIGASDDEIPESLRRFLNFSEEDWVEVTATIFEAGDYPDKGISVDPEDLERLAEAAAGKPILLEHLKSGIRLGEILRAWREGTRLRAVLRFMKSAYDWVKSQGLRGLSVAISPDASQLHEVSVVTSPRVPSAQFGGAEGQQDILYIYFSLPIPDEDPASTSTHSPYPKEEVHMNEEIEELKARIQEYEQRISDLETHLQEERKQRQLLEFAYKKQEISHRVDGLVERGKVPPALRPILISLYMGENAVEFNGESIPPHEALLRAFEDLPTLFHTIPTGSGEPEDYTKERNLLKSMGWSDEEIPKILEEYKQLIQSKEV